MTFSVEIRLAQMSTLGRKKTLFVRASGVDATTDQTWVHVLKANPYERQSFFLKIYLIQINSISKTRFTFFTKNKINFNFLSLMIVCDYE